MNKALILMAHGSSDPRWREPFERVYQALGERLPTPLRLAYMELSEPSLETTVAELADAGTERAEILPLFFAAGRHLRKDVPAQVEALGTRHPDIALTLLPPVGEHPDFIEALAAVIAERAGE
ncbi:sirohydrochlorin chelatase [Halomonas elongata]|uniref:sirohydrochlorin chelatase n=1 Tax=Halomonas elongata TaxID=2746 RepID=UPI00186BA244|nr:CbiX/SirB N-terminal domain-containing protein [Halomonas elongata]MBW5801255.1 CbiX/SirB N-terminal domain-containing protein [Halomonas elongata]